MTATDGVAVIGAPDTAKRLIITLTTVIFLQWTGASSLVPMLPEYIRHLGGSDALAGIVMASFFAAGVLFQYPAGRLADRIGRRPVLISGLVLYGLASLSFLLPITADVAVALRALQGAGEGAAMVAGLAMISSAVPLEGRGRAFATIYAGELAGLAVGPLIGSILGIRFLWIMFLASGLLSFGACIPALRLREVVPDAGHDGRGAVDGGERSALRRVRMSRSMTGALVCGGALGLTSGVYEICWTLLLLSRGASGLEIGISWTLFAVPFVLATKPSGWLADHMDRRVLVLAGIGMSALFCASYPFINSVPALVVLGAMEAVGFAAAMPAVQSLLTQGSDPTEVGRIQGLFATSQTTFTALSAAAAGAAFALVSWLPFVTVAGIVAVSLIAAAFIWRSVPGRVQRSEGDLATAPSGAFELPAQVFGPGPVGVSAEVQ
jgi:DHA1 family multidrug resistance protein-like MFS transporter